MASVSINQVLRFYGITIKESATATTPTPSPILISIDFEAWERDQSIITEVGISVLDTADISADKDEQVPVIDWVYSIQCAHYRTWEYRHKKYTNFRWVSGCPDDFLFGTTRLVSKSKVAQMLKNLFVQPTQLRRINAKEFDFSQTTVPIILVGHALGGDVKYAAQLGFTFPTNIGRADTQRGPYGRQGPGLSRLLNALGIEYSHLHNAGNDAAYTLEAMFTLAAVEMKAPGTTFAALKQS